MESELKVLLARNYDSQKGYEHIADNTEDEDMRAFFRNNAKERHRFGKEIRDMIREYGGTPVHGANVKGNLHRAWVNLRDKFTHSGPRAMLDEAEHGEELAMRDYREVVTDEALKPVHRRVLSDHLHAIRNSKQQIHNLKNLV